MLRCIRGMQGAVFRRRASCLWCSQKQTLMMISTFEKYVKRCAGRGGARTCGEVLVHEVGLHGRMAAVQGVLGRRVEVVLNQLPLGGAHLHHVARRHVHLPHHPAHAPWKPGAAPVRTCTLPAGPAEAPCGGAEQLPLHSSR